MRIRWSYLLMVWGATLLPLFIAGYLVYNASYRRNESAAGENLRLLTRLVASEVDQYVLNVRDRVRARASSMEFTTLADAPAIDLAKLSQVLLGVHNIDPLNVSSVAFLDPKGFKVADSDAQQGTVDESATPWVLETLATGSGSIHAEVLTAKPSFWMTAPVRRSSGELAGLVRVRFELSSLQQIIARVTSNIETYAVLLDDTGTILAHGKEPAAIGRVAKLTFRPRTGNAELAPYGAKLFDESNVEERFALQGLSHVPWSVAVLQAHSTYMGGNRTIARQFFILAICAMIIGGAAALLAAHLMARPILKLASVAKQIEQGSIDAVFPRKGPVEIAELADAFNQMTDRLKLSYRELERQVEETRENEKRLRDVISANPIALAVVDETGFVVRLNPSFNQLLGYSLSDIPTVQDLWLRLFPEADGLDRFRFEFTRHLNAEAGVGEGANPIEVEIPARTGAKKVVEIRARVFGPMVIIAFHDLTARRRAELEVVRLNVDLEQRVASRTAELTQANAELESFSYAVSHDLRAPLRAIDGFSRALQEDYAPKLDGEALDYLARIRAASQRMGTLIDDLLTLSKVSRAEVHRERFNLSAMVRTSWDALASSDGRRHVSFECAEGLMAEGDLGLIRIVIDNLLSNAWKYTRKRQDAVVRFYGKTQPAPMGREERVFVLEDNGAGFDMRYAGKLFGAFQRLHGQSEFEGTGIGLATVRRIINRHGGRIWAQAEVDKGATFFFTLAEARAASAARSTDSHSPFTTSAPRPWP